jgi:Protein of unknown function (DUF2586)
MALNNIIFNLGQGGLGRVLPGQDYVSGLIFYTSGSLPSGFTSSANILNFGSVADAEAAGILATYPDETAATGSYLVTTAGTNGDTVTLFVADPFNGATVIGSYTKITGDSTPAAVATKIAAAINALTFTTGYSATVSSATVTIIARSGLGIALNSGTPITAAYSASATLAGTITQFSGGVGSKQAVWHYHISEYFRLQPNGSLYVGIFPVPGSYTFAEISTMQIFSGGIIRQIGIYKDSAAFATADITAIHGQCATLVNAHREIIALYGADLSGTSDLTTLANLSLLSASYCTAVISQDGAGFGSKLYTTYGKSITTLGAALGAVSLSAVSESIAWPAKFNISNGTECDTIAFANGQLRSDSRTTDSLLSQLNSYRYLFLRKFVGVAGSYFNDNPTSIALTSDYAYINNTRTIQKATRGVYAALVPALNSPITLNADGTIADYSAAYFTNLAEAPLQQMISDGDLSDMSVAVNPAQNVLSTSKVVVLINLLPKGTARNIVVNIGFNVKIS